MPMSRPDTLPRDPRDVTRLRGVDALLFGGMMRFADRTGIWRYPARASGDLETMRFLDRVYWLYKSRNPTRRAVRGSGLERFFERQKERVWRLPEGFEAQSAVRLSAVGDLMNHAFLAGSGETLYRHVEDLIFGVDVAMANLECVVLRSPDAPLVIDVARTKVGPALYFEPTAFDVVAGIRARRYDFMATACNHSLDHGAAGVASTIDALRTRGIAFHGVNESEEDAGRMTILDVRGVRVGVVSFSFGLNAYRPPPDRPHIVNRLRLDGRAGNIDWSQVREQLEHGRREGAEFVVAQLHWGMEFEFYPRPEQIEIAHHLAEMGIDAIVGHHPHVLQPTESYRTHRDSDRVVPILYSLGNLTNPFEAPWLCRSGVARIDLARGIHRDGSPKVYVENVEVVPVVQEADATHRRLALKRE